MNTFLKLSLRIVLLIVLIAVALDISYTSIYKQSTSRGKIDKVYSSSACKYDVIVLGSSRANNHFVSELFEKQGYKTFNFGTSGSQLFEADLLLKLMIERKYKIKNLIIVVDLSLSNDHRADGSASKFLPYIHDSEIVRKHFEKESDYDYLYFVPFYRYIKYDAQIGFRETFFSAIKKKSKLLNNGGYYALDNQIKGNMQNDITNLEPLPHNKYYEDIKAICKSNNIRLISVMTPMCENTRGINYFEKVKEAYPEIYNYENAVIEDRYFSSCGHLNDTGARKFTKVILNDFF